MKTQRAPFIDRRHFLRGLGMALALPVCDSLNVDFRSLLIERHDQFTRSLSEKLMTYALGREPALTDRAVIDEILKDLSSDKGGFKDLIRAVVLSESFAKN